MTPINPAAPNGRTARTHLRWDVVACARPGRGLERLRSRREDGKQKLRGREIRKWKNVLLYAGYPSKRARPATRRGAHAFARVLRQVLNQLDGQISKRRTENNLGVGRSETNLPNLQNCLLAADHAPMLTGRWLPFTERVHQYVPADPEPRERPKGQARRGKRGAKLTKERKRGFS